MNAVLMAVLIGMAPARLMEEPKSVQQQETVATIRIPATVSVGSERLRLGEIAHLECRDPELQTRLAQVELGAAPLPGAKRAFTRTQLLTRLRQHRFDLRQIAIEMPDTIQIERRAQSLEPSALEQFARQQIAQLTGEDIREWKLENPPSTSFLPEGTAEYRVETPPRVANGVAQIGVAVVVEGRVRARALLRFRAPTQVRPLLVRSGETVRVRVRVEGVIVEVSGQARSAGAIGEVISVYLPDTQKTVRARVVEQSEVEVVL